MPGSFVGPARELIGLGPAELASQLGVTDEVVTAWEADERPLPARKFVALLRLFNTDQRRAFVERVFGPMLEARFGVKFADLDLEGSPNLTRSVGTPQHSGSAPTEST